MITPDSKALKRWRRGVKRKLKASPTLWRDFKRARSMRVASSLWGKLRVFVPVGIITALSADVPIEPTARWLLLWTALLMFIRGQQICTHLYKPDSLWLWFGWPVSNDEVYVHQRGLVLRASAWLAVDWLAFGLAAAWRADDPVLAIAAPVLAVGEWAALLAITVWLARWRPRFPFGVFIMPLGIVLFLVIRVKDQRNVFQPIIDMLFHGLHAGMPMGWLMQGWEAVRAGQRVGWLVLFGLGAVAVGALIAGEKAIRKTFNPEAIFGYEEIPADDPEGGGMAVPDSEPWSPVPDLHRETVPVNMEFLRSGMAEVFDAPAGLALTRRGSVERAAGWFLSARQRTLVDFMLPVGMSWMRRWMIAAAVLAVVPVVRAVWGNVATLPAIAALVCAMPITGGRWLGFEAMRSFQSQIGLAANVPAGFGEIARLVLKLNALHCVMAFPFVLTGVWLGFAPVHAPAWWALDYSVRGLGLVLALQPIWLLAKFSRNTNDSSAGRWFTLGLMLSIIGGVIVGVALGVTILTVETPVVALACLGGLMGLTHATLALYGWAWARGMFDLIAKVK